MPRPEGKTVSGDDPSERAARLDPAAPLRELSERVQAGNPDLYRQLALYLQVLREVLPDRVERACFHLATQLQPRRYAAIPEQDRRQLHRRVQSLVQRCTSLLTVEQLCTLAAQMARERQRQERRQRQELMHRFAAAAPSSGGSDQGRGNHPGEDDLPEGSVRLGMALPFNADPFTARGGWAEASRLASALIAKDGGAHEPGGADPDGEGSDPLAAFDAAGGSEAYGDPFRSNRTEGSRSDPWSAGQLPQDPIQLLSWLDGLEQALLRRLRNLSHAINVELLRHGLSSTLLPVSLLDAVLSGQLEPQPAPANLLRLQLPFAPEAPDGALQALAVLLRPADLELEEPRLRTCRRRLQQHRQEVRRMAQQYRRLQRWREAHASEQLWLQDLKASRNPPT